MSRLQTSIQHPSLNMGDGFRWDGELSADDAIERFRRQAQRMLHVAETILKASDDEFHIRLVRGVHVSKCVKIIQEGSIKP